MRFFIFSDLHQFDRDKLNKTKEDFDVLVFLGDTPTSAIRAVMDYFPEKKAFGVLGNHDDENMFDSVNQIIEAVSLITKEKREKIEDINLKREEINEISFVGLQGCVRYSETCLGYTQEEASSLYIPEADILFGHESGYHYINNNKGTHEGFKAVSEYIKENKPKYHFFGHHHINCSFIKEKTKCFGIYGYAIFDTKDESIQYY